MRTPQEQPEKIELGLNIDEAKRLLTEAMPFLAETYDAISEGDNANTKRPGVFEENVFFAQKLPGEINVTLLATKCFRTTRDNNPDTGTYPWIAAGDKNEYLYLHLMRGEVTDETQKARREIIGGHEEVGSFYLWKRGNDWEITHREVGGKYREQGVGTLLLEAVNSFVQAHVDNNNAAEKLTVNLGQPSVLRFFTERGFTPRSGTDKRRAFEIENANPNLVTAFAEIKDVDLQGNLTGKTHPETYKDPYVFEKHARGRTERDAYRLELERTFLPKGQARQVSAVLAKIHGDIKNTRS